MGIDRRTQFDDLADVDPADRTSRSNVVQFYSAYPNIGNYLPVFGIREMLGVDTDLWDAHDDDLDWTFVNRNYSWGIIGGAGLLHETFESFWREFDAHCNIPFVVWGVGACFPDADGAPAVSRSVARSVLEEAELVNLRDDLTRDYYEVSAHVSPCPTLAYLTASERERTETRPRILYSSHTGLVEDGERQKLYSVMEQSPYEFEYTNHMERRLKGLEQIVDQYARNSLVMTTRLHGTVIAYALQTPYIAVPRDDKIRAFHRLYGNGQVVEEIDEVKDILRSGPEIEIGSIERDLVYQFGARVKEHFEVEDARVHRTRRGVRN